MVDRIDDFRQVCGLDLAAAYPAPPIPPFLSRVLSLPKQQPVGLSAAEVQEWQRLSSRFLEVASACANELTRIQTQLRQRRGAASAARQRQYVEGRLETETAATASRALGREEISLLLARVLKQQREAEALGALAEDVSDLRAMHALRESWAESLSSQQGAGRRSPSKGGGLEFKDALAHRQQVLRCIDSTAKELTAELKKKELQVLRAEMEASRHFSAAAAAAAASRGAAREGAAAPSPKMFAAGAAAEAAEFVSTAMRLRAQDKKRRPQQQQAAALEAEEVAAAEEPSQQRLLAEEAVLLRELQNDRVDAIVAVQRQLQQVVQTMDVFSFKVEEQAEVCEQIHALAEAAAKNVDDAHKHLLTALSRKSSFRQMICYTMGLLGLLVLFLDYLTSSRPYLL